MAGEPALRDLLAVAQEAAWVGGRRTLAYFRTGTATEWKSDQTPVTAADRESERLIRGVISRAFPDHTILGEEDGETAGTAPVRWIVDPLDGTRTFTRFPGFRPDDSPSTSSVSCPVRPSDFALCPAGNSSGMTPMPTRLLRWMRSKLSAITTRTPSSSVPFAAQSRDDPVPYSLPAITASGTPSRA